MKEFAILQEFDDQATVYFNVEAEEIMSIGAKMESIHEEAYMNGYNWEAFLNHYLQQTQPELVDGLDHDSEAGTYVAQYDKEHTNKAKKLVSQINDLLNNPDKVYDYLHQHSEHIEWD